MRAAEGDDEAFESLHERFGAGLLHFFSKRLGPRHELAEELSQTSWIELWQALRKGRYDPQRAALSTFLYAIAYRVWLRHCRANGATAVVQADELIQFVPLETDDPSAFLHLCEELDALRVALAARNTPLSLTPEECDVLRGLSEGRSERDLARQFSLAASTIHSRKLSAYNKLRSALESSVRTTQPSAPGLAADNTPGAGDRR